MAISRLALPLLSLSLCAGVAEAKATPGAPSACAAQPLFNRASLEEWPRNARLVVRDGQTVGLRFYALDAAEPMARAGLKEGDVLLKVAGVELTSPEQALAAYARLRRGACSTMTVEREGAAVEIPLRLR
jgi:hypothetical protein